jgi:CheY-like chemotaxis protein
MGGQGRLTFETANAYLDEDYVSHHAEIAVGQYVLICVSDTGEGMLPEVIAKVFDPFFTTKPIGQGTGLGLSMVYGFVRQSGGHVTIYSEVGQGATIKIYLPRHHFRPEEAEATPALHVPDTKAHGEKILVVEDEEEVRNVIVETLRDIGYAMIAAPDARAALAYIAKEPGINLLLTDVGLRDGVNGRQLAEECLRQRPDLKVLFMTGYARNAIVHHGRVDPGVHLLSKPFTREALARKIAEMLGRNATA